ncbi:MAG TPA: hypothetical protein VEI95_15375, partial [Acidobacteriota bacterium]|nr:hypothetical protein [Acidobacteriota bacterium]
GLYSVCIWASGLENESKICALFNAFPTNVYQNNKYWKQCARLTISAETLCAVSRKRAAMWTMPAFDLVREVNGKSETIFNIKTSGAEISLPERLRKRNFVK